MFRKSIAKNIGYPLQDYLKKTNIFETLAFLKESQYWEETKLEEYRIEKLRDLIEFAHRNVPYYERLFNLIKLKSYDIKHLEDINKIPVLTKETVRKASGDLIAKNFNMKYVKKGKTGGTTGAPLIIFKDVNNRSFTWASYYRWYDWMGIDYGDKAATFWGARAVLTNTAKKRVIDFITNYVQNNLALNSFNMREDKMYFIYERIKKFRPVIIKGYTSALIHLGKYIEANSLEGLKPKVISSTSEMLLPHNRRYLEKIYEAPIFDQYGCGELSAVSYECPKHNGLHITQEHVICEILDNDGNPVINKLGRIIGTDLDNYVMPFIRYEIGDLASISTIKCTCGVNQPLMNSIYGRTIDTITLKDGSKVHGVFFSDIFFEMGIHANNISRFQVYQVDPGAIEFRYETSKLGDRSIKNRLSEVLNQFFTKVEIIETDYLMCDKNGKFRYIINETERL